MRKKILPFLCVFLLLALTAVCCLAASSQGRLLQILDSGKALLFDTENVTIRGNAEFLLDGETFKKADILYMQDMKYSHWQLDLLTPRPGLDDRETGYTIIANGENVYVIERYTPGVYKTGTHQPANTIISQSAGSDLLLRTAYALADPVEGLLPEGTVTASETDEGTELKITLSRETTPAMLTPLVDMAAQFTLHRFLGVDFDGIRDWAVGPFDNYLTVTDGIIYTTSSYQPGEISVTVRLDDKGRISAVSGTVNMILLSKTEPERTLTVVFDASVSDYGTTYLRSFDPEEFSVIPAV